MEVEWLANLRGLAGFPDEDDVVIGLVIGGHFDEVELAVFEAAEGFDCDTGAVVVAGFGILVVGEGTIALNEAPGARVFQGEDAVAELVVAVFERAVVEVAAAEFHQEAIAVVHFGAEVVGARVGVFAEPEHAGEGGEAELLDGSAEGDFGLDIDGGFGAWGDGELVGTGDAFAFEQGMSDEGLCVFGRFFEVELGEVGKLFGHAG